MARPTQPISYRPRFSQLRRWVRYVAVAGLTTLIALGTLGVAVIWSSNSGS